MPPLTEVAESPRFRRIAQGLGPALFLVLAAFGPAELTPAGRRTLGVAAWMVTWWITECVPIIAPASCWMRSRCCSSPAWWRSWHRSCWAS